MNDESRIRDFARRYTAAWCSQNPSAVAEFFEPQGSLTINGGLSAIGRAAIANDARAFMTAFPDLRVSMEAVVFRQDCVEYHWTLDGHNTGPAGSGNRVQISGFEKWKFGTSGLIRESQGHFDAAEYQRQIEHGTPGTH